MTEDEAVDLVESLVLRARAGEDVGAALLALPAQLRAEATEVIAAERHLWAAIGAGHGDAPGSPSREAPARIGPYSVERELARGGMGVVYQAVDRDGRTVAVKVCAARRPGHSDRFLREARAVGRLRHPNIVRVVDVGVDRQRDPARPDTDELLWFAMERIEGETLDQIAKGGGPFDPREAARIGLDLARALAHAHAAGVLHRDVKPHNVLLRRLDRAPVLIDFGLAKLDDDDDPLTSTGAVLGTPSHMSPEQGAGKKADVRTDTWGLGATLYDLLTGRPPIRGTTIREVLLALNKGHVEPPRALRPDVPAALEGIVLRALQKDPAKRPTVSALAADLERFLGSQR